MIEYGMIAALISIAAIVVLPIIGDRLLIAFTKVKDALPAA